MGRLVLIWRRARAATRHALLRSHPDGGLDGSKRAVNQGLRDPHPSQTSIAKVSSATAIPQGARVEITGNGVNGSFWAQPMEADNLLQSPVIGHAVHVRRLRDLNTGKLHTRTTVDLDAASGAD